MTIPAYIGAMVYVSGIILPVHYMLYSLLSDQFSKKKSEFIIVLAVSLIGFSVFLTTYHYFILYLLSAYILFIYIQRICRKECWKNIPGAFFCFILSAPIVFLFIYLEVAFLLLTQYSDIVYPSVVFFFFSISLSAYIMRRHQCLTPMRLYSTFLAATLISIFSSEFLLEKYIEDVSRSKYGKETDVHIQMNILSSHPYLSDNHAAIKHKEHGLMIWSFKERDFIKYTTQR